MRNQKGLASVLTILFLVAVVVLISLGLLLYFKPHGTVTLVSSPAPIQVQPTPMPSPDVKLDPKTGWNMYSNPGLSLEFPPDWKLSEQMLYGANNPSSVATLVSPDLHVTVQVSAKKWFDEGGCGAPCPSPAQTTLIINGKKYSARQNSIPFDYTLDNSQSGSSSPGLTTKVQTALTNPDFLPMGAVLIESTPADLQKNLDTIQKILGTVQANQATGN